MCQYLNCITRAWQTDSFADSTRAEDRVDEHCGVEGHSSAAQAVIAGLDVLSHGCDVPRLVSVDALVREHCTTESQRRREIKKRMWPFEPLISAKFSADCACLLCVSVSAVKDFVWLAAGVALC
jgi:hypothetical protein